MHIGVYGFVDPEGGSVTAANYLLLGELLRRGHTVDFFTFAGFAEPGDLRGHAGFRCVEVISEGDQKLYRWIPQALHRHLVPALSLFYYHFVSIRLIGQAVAAEHERKPYDALLFMGTGAQFAVPADVPVISWVQGPPQTEWESIRGLRPLLFETEGRALFYKLRAYYRFKEWRARGEFRRSDRVLCGSRWAREKIVDSGVPRERVHSLPYPIDRTLFAPMPLAEKEEVRFLWIGRIDPRKRLDLLLKAYRRLVLEHRDVHLTIAGSFPYAEGLKGLIDDFPFPDRITFMPPIDRCEVPALIGRHHVVIQPSENENFGSAVAESLCCGRPVVVGPTNGTREYVADEVRFDFHSYDPLSLLDAMRRARRGVLMNGEAIRAEAVRNAREAFDVRIVGEQLESLIGSSCKSLSVAA